MAGEPFVELKNITKRFGGLMALGGVSLDVHPGEVLAIVGDNGAGKSTLIKILSGVYSATSGSIVVGGREVTINTPNDARELGIETVHQSLGLVDTLNAWENFFLGNEIHKSYLGGFLRVLDNKTMRIEAERTLKEKLNMVIPDAHRPVYFRSGGQKQAIAIGRTLYHQDVKLLVLDEPTAALGPEESDRILQLVRDLRDNGLAIIMISHNIDQVVDVADRAAVFWRGRVMGTVDPKTTGHTAIVEMIMGRDVMKGAA